MSVPGRRAGGGPATDRLWALSAALVVAPVLGGLLFMLLPAFGYFPALGGDSWSLQPWHALAAQPGLLSALRATLVSGFLATPMALAFALVLVARVAPDGSVPRGMPRSLAAVLSWLLATPHAAFAIGLAFLLAPSGWLVRLLALALPIDQPPDLLVFRDPWGLGLALGLVLKETPFLFFAALAALRQLAPGALLHLGATLGYAPGMAWLKLVLPRLFGLMRLPIYAALAYALSAVDMALVLGPSAPPSLAVLTFDLARDPDLGQRFPAAALALLHLGIVLVALLAWRGVELAGARLLRPLLADGRRQASPLHRGLAAIWISGAYASLLLAALSILSLPLWSLADAWRFPDTWPQCCNLAAWRRAASGLSWPLVDSLAVAGAVSLCSLIGAIAWLFFEPRSREAPNARAIRWARGAVALPLVISDLAFLMGVQILLLAIGIGGGLLPVFLVHCLFAFPYVLLALAGPWARLDPRYERAAICLGAPPSRVLLRVRLPLLLPALSFAAALGFAVSLSLYLPTVMAGGGRVATLASEAIALASGGDRRVTGVYGTIQALVIWLGFAAAFGAARRHRYAVMA